MSVSNHSLALLRKYREAVLHFFPWRMREMVVRAGHMAGRDSNKADRIGFILNPILFMGEKHLAALGERWRLSK